MAEMLEIGILEIWNWLKKKRPHLTVWPFFLLSIVDDVRTRVIRLPQADRLQDMAVW